MASGYAGNNFDESGGWNLGPSSYSFGLFDLTVKTAFETAEIPIEKDSLRALRDACTELLGEGDTVDETTTEAEVMEKQKPEQADYLGVGESVWVRGYSEVKIALRPAGQELGTVHNLSTDDALELYNALGRELRKVGVLKSEEEMAGVKSPAKKPVPPRDRPQDPQAPIQWPPPTDVCPQPYERDRRRYPFGPQYPHGFPPRITFSSNVPEMTRAHWEAMREAMQDNAGTE
jgi:hypothetical protein